MTLSADTSRMDCVGNNTTATYSYTFKIFADSDLVVTETDTNGVESTLDLNVDYSVTGAGDSDGGSITLLAGNLATNHLLAIERIMPITQETDIRNQGDFFPETIEDEFDRLVMVDQQQQVYLDKSLKLPRGISSDDFDTTLPTDIADHPGSAIIVNSTGDGLDLGVDTGGVDASRVAKIGDNMTGNLGMLGLSAVRFYRTNNTHYTGWKGSDSTTIDQDYSMPPALPTGTGGWLNSNTSGATQWRTTDQLATDMGTSGIDFITLGSYPRYLDTDAILNLGLVTTVAASALTISLKAADVSALSSTNVGRLTMRSATATDGTSTRRDLTANISITVPSSATLGSQNAIPDYLYIWALDNAGTIELGVSGSGFVPVDGIASSTAISSSATSVSTLYSTTARSNVPIRLLGRALYTQTTAGTWASQVTTLELNGRGRNLQYEYGSFTANFNQSAGASGANTSKTISFTRIGKTVTLVFPNCSDMTAGATAAQFSTVSATLLNRLLPSASLFFPVIMKTNGSISNTPGYIQIGSDGTISLTRDLVGTANFTSTQTNNGPINVSVSYTTQ